MKVGTNVSECTFIKIAYRFDAPTTVRPPTPTGAPASLASALDGFFFFFFDETDTNPASEFSTDSEDPADGYRLVTDDSAAVSMWRRERYSDANDRAMSFSLMVSRMTSTMVCGSDNGASKSTNDATTEC